MWKSFGAGMLSLCSACASVEAPFAPGARPPGRAAASSGSGSSGGSGGAASGTTSGPISLCPAAATNLPLTDCGSGLIEVLGNVVDVCGSASPDFQAVTTPVDVDDSQNPTVNGRTDGCGYFHLCVPPGQRVQPSLSAAGFVPTDLPPITAASSEQLPNHPGMYLLCENERVDLETVLQASPTAASVVISVFSLSGNPPCGDLSGWDLSLVTLDGGEAIDAGVAYVNGLTPDPFALGTGESGLAVLYNVDPDSPKVRLAGIRADNQLPDGGEQCPNIGSEPPFQFTGEVPLTSGRFTYVPYVVP